MTEAKTTAADDKVAAGGGSPTSDKKAADTAEEYEQLTGQADTPASDSDPVIDAIEESTADIEQPDIGEPAWINKDYEEREQVEYVDVSGDDEWRADPHGHTSDDDSDDDGKKPAAKKTAAKK
jgi:hypothetical protein